MMTQKLSIKPLSVNECWKGRRFKTDLYKNYARHVAVSLKAQQLPPPPYIIEFVFGVSNMSADWDNPIKPLQDIIAKKMNFNDALIFKGSGEKTKVEKGDEFIQFTIRTHNLKQACPCCESLNTYQTEAIYCTRSAVTTEI